MCNGNKIRLKKVKGLKDQGALGLYFPADSSIHFDESLLSQPIVFWETILHEFGHAVWDMSSLSQTSIPLDLQEIIVDQIAINFVRSFKLSFNNE